jgi:ABC-type dipeptide/oligopeptide/nickel transport system permease component
MKLFLKVLSIMIILIALTFVPYVGIMVIRINPELTKLFLPVLTLIYMSIAFYLRMVVMYYQNSIDQPYLKYLFYSGLIITTYAFLNKMLIQLNIMHPLFGLLSIAVIIVFVVVFLYTSVRYIFKLVL